MVQCGFFDGHYIRNHFHLYVIIVTVDPFKYFISVGALLFPEPTYSGPDNVIYFRGLQGLEDELSRKDCYWLVTFYTVWNPGCVNYAPIFAKLSTEYCLENLKFGKLDVGRYPDAAQKYHVNDSSLSKQLPTTILFKEGKEVVRRPAIDTKGNIMKFFFSSENIKGAFNLNNLYEECKNTLKTKKKHIKKD